NPWFQFGEGDKGEALSRFLGLQFLIRTFPGIAAIPTLALSNGFWNVTRFWLNGDRSLADDWLEADDTDVMPDADTGCLPLFLFYLHDQLGFSIEQIINAGASRYSNLYENLTGDSWTHAWPKFTALVNSHYPLSAGGLFPPLETVFPVSELTSF